MELTSKDLTLLTYLTRHCPSPNKGGALILDRGWEKPEESKKTHATNLGLALGLDSAQLEGCALKLKGAGWVGLEISKNTMWLWITVAGKEKADAKSGKDSPQATQSRNDGERREHRRRSVTRRKPSLPPLTGVSESARQRCDSRSRS
jgi:hypothetical protein